MAQMLGMEIDRAARIIGKLVGHHLLCDFIGPGVLCGVGVVNRIDKPACADDMAIGLPPSAHHAVFGHVSDSLKVGVRIAGFAVCGVRQAGQIVMRQVGLMVIMLDTLGVEGVLMMPLVVMPCFGNDR